MSQFDDAGRDRDDDNSGQVGIDLVPVQVLFHSCSRGPATSTLDVISLEPWTSSEGRHFPAGSPLTWAFHHDVVVGRALDLTETFDRWASHAEVIEMGTIEVDGVGWIVMVGEEDRVAMEVASRGGWG